MASVFPPMTFTADTLRRPSGNLWRDCPLTRFNQGLVGGVYQYDDFTEYGPITAVTSDAHLIGLPYMGFNSTGGTHTYGDVQGGTLICTEATDNEASFVRRNSWPFQISSLLGDLWFETRIKVSAITNNQIGFIAGLMDNNALTVSSPLSAANPPVLEATNTNFVGFWGREQDAGLVRFIYKANGVTEVSMVDSAHQFVADTYVKLGFKFSRNYKNTNVAKIEGYVNGVALGSPKTVPDATGTDFPADVRLGFMFGHRLGASTSSLTTCDWYQAFQMDTVSE